MKENLADILHITDQEQAHLVPMDCKIPVSITVHDLFHLEPRKISTKQGEISIGDNRPGLLRRQDLKHIRRGLERADLLICISEATAENSQIMAKKSIAVVPHGIDVRLRSNRLSLPKPEGLDQQNQSPLWVAKNPVSGWIFSSRC